MSIKFQWIVVRNNIYLRTKASRLMFLFLPLLISSCGRALICARSEMYASGDVAGGLITLQSDWKPVKSYFMFKRKSLFKRGDFEISGGCFVHATGQKNKLYHVNRKYIDSTEKKGYHFLRMHCIDTAHVNCCIDLFETKTESYLVFKSDDKKRIYKVRLVEPGDIDYPFTRKKARLF